MDGEGECWIAEWAACTANHHLAAALAASLHSSPQGCSAPVRRALAFSSLRGAFSGPDASPLHMGAVPFLMEQLRVFRGAVPSKQVDIMYFHTRIYVILEAFVNSTDFSPALDYAIALLLDEASLQRQTLPAEDSESLELFQATAKITQKLRDEGRDSDILENVDAAEKVFEFCDFLGYSSEETPRLTELAQQYLEGKLKLSQSPVRSKPKEKFSDSSTNDKAKEKVSKAPTITTAKDSSSSSSHVQNDHITPALVSKHSDSSTQNQLVQDQLTAQRVAVQKLINKSSGSNGKYPKKRAGPQTQDENPDAEEQGQNIDLGSIENHPERTANGKAEKKADEKVAASDADMEDISESSSTIDDDDQDYSTSSAKKRSSIGSAVGTPQTKKRKLPPQSYAPESSSKRRRWTSEEEQYLMEGVRKYGEGRWQVILKAYKFNDRTTINLKDKWRNLKKFNHVS